MLDCIYAPKSHVTEVADPGMVPLFGPTAYVLPLLHTALTVRDVGVAITSVKFQAKVRVLLVAIL